MSNARIGRAVSRLRENARLTELPEAAADELTGQSPHQAILSLLPMLHTGLAHFGEASAVTTRLVRGCPIVRQAPGPALFGKGKAAPTRYREARHGGITALVHSLACRVRRNWRSSRAAAVARSMQSTSSVTTAIRPAAGIRSKTNTAAAIIGYTNAAIADSRQALPSARARSLPRASSVATISASSASHRLATNHSEKRLRSGRLW
jgi:hypothetical protein